MPACCCSCVYSCAHNCTHSCTHSCTYSCIPASYATYAPGTLTLCCTTDLEDELEELDGRQAEAAADGEAAGRRNRYDDFGEDISDEMDDFIVDGEDGDRRRARRRRDSRMAEAAGLSTAAVQVGEAACVVGGWWQTGGECICLPVCLSSCLSVWCRVRERHLQNTPTGAHLATAGCYTG